MSHWYSKYFEMWILNLISDKNKTKFFLQFFLLSINSNATFSAAQATISISYTFSIYPKFNLIFYILFATYSLHSSQGNTVVKYKSDVIPSNVVPFHTE